MLELDDRSVVKPIATLEDISISIESWEFPVDFLVINPRIRLDGHSLILGQPWLATTYAYIGCPTCNMKIAGGSVVKNLILYPPTKTSVYVIHRQLQPPRYP
jgi:hypothetical protein